MEGFTDKGAVYYEKEENGDIVEEIDWWPQAEAVVGLLNAFQISQDNKYLDLATKAWNFIDKYIKNKKYGEWFYKVKPDGEPYHNKNKVSEWKGPYHSVRACMEAIERLENIISIQGE
jgi:mannobiose 2-epimerase